MFNFTSELLVATVGMLASLLGLYEADMHLDPQKGSSVLSETFTVSVIIESSIPVNVFMGDISFDHQHLTIESIDYNQSVADLWTTEPWYSNGEGTINFAGGTTQTGGFTGQDTIITITFNTKKVGDAQVVFKDIKIFRHDGLGNEANTAEPIDGLFSIQNTANKVITEKSGNKTQFFVLSDTQTTDLNGDGQQTLADLSIFMRDFATQNFRSDFNVDGKVNLSDMSIMLDAQ
jgi:hypothetical protein